MGQATRTPSPDTRSAVTLRVSGSPYELELDHRTTLLDALREQLGLTCSKKGCDHGQCGSCTVLVDGRRVNACLTLAMSVRGRPVTTIEGIAGPGGLHPVQEQFLECDAYQCGYCTPGQVVSAVAVLDEVRLGWPSAVTEQSALAVPGVLHVLDAGNAPALAATDDSELLVLQSTRVSYRGQVVAMVLADTLEAAREGARSLRVTCDEQPHDVLLTREHHKLYAPGKVNPAFPTDTAGGRPRRGTGRRRPRRRRRVRHACALQQPDGAARHDRAVGR